MKLNVDAHLWCLGTYAERYVPGGYYDDMALEEKLEIMSKIQGLSGLVVFYPPDPLPSDPEKIIKKLSDYNMKVSYLEPEVWSDRKWKHGAFSTSEKNIRKEAVKFMKEAVDYSRELRAESVLLWPAHDGFDYPFQTDYQEGWKYLVESLQEIGEHDRNAKIAVEYKSKDPRQKQYVSNVGKEMMLLNDVGLDNVGGVIDTGHALMAQESLAESLMILDSHRKLFQIHLNENYKDSDPDMIIGTVNFWETLEFFYYLNKTNFQGWSSIDIIAGRDDRVQSLDLAVTFTWKYKQMADKLSRHSEEIDNNLKGYRFTDNMNLLSDVLFS
jgi:xylose isomerase